MSLLSAAAIRLTEKPLVPQQDVGIGVPEFQDPDELRLPEIVRMPFGQQRPFWMLPGDGTPERLAVPTLPRCTLAE